VALSEALAFTIIMMASLAGMALVLSSFTFIIRYSIEEHHLRVMLFGLFSIRSIPYRQMREVRVIPWWKGSLQNSFGQKGGIAIYLSREYVVIATVNSLCPYVFLSPSAPAIFATTLSSRIAKTMLCSA